MSTDLTTIFGTEIRVSDKPRIVQRSYNSYPGIDGLTTIHMGSRGYLITIQGRLATSGGDYATNRLAMQTSIANIESYLYADPDSYTYMSNTYDNVIFETFDTIPDANGKQYHLIAGGAIICDFVATLRVLI